jgi:hypothetical protein
MRKNIFRFALLSAFVSVIASCQKNDDNGPTGGGGGGLDRDKFITTASAPWIVESHHSPSGQTLFWNMHVFAGNSSNEILLDNFDQMGNGNYVIATVSDNSFTISQQTAGDSTTYSGTGTYNTNNNTISFNYTADDGVQVDNVSASAHK